MKKQLLALFAFLLTSVSLYSQNYSTQGVYVGVLSGVNLEYFKHHNFKTHPGYQIGGSVGYKFCNNIRVEGEFSYRRNSYKHQFHGHRELLTYMANAFYDFDLNCEWTPYIGVGVGYERAKSKSRFHERSDSSSSESDSELASVSGSDSIDDLDESSSSVRVTNRCKDNNAVWQGIAGLSYRLACNTELGAEYRILLSQEKNYNHLFALSLRQYF